ncbi:hypothetical protein RclHR1_01470005 [Rhizophagus clarus]|uniref:Uncharacterized protein n=1 Tax=Rhizophagus clarus TaxID=94130 RepID=A0A2Z6QDB8_9GLOM|nr:hypothetical protein RclHR1_01470005 [Rhizophagus clarus]
MYTTFVVTALAVGYFLGRQYRAHIHVYTCTNFSFSKKFPESLTRFKQATKEVIVKWHKTARENDRSMDDLEDDDPYIDSILIIIVWNYNALTTQNIQKIL